MVRVRGFWIRIVVGVVLGVGGVMFLLDPSRAPFWVLVALVSTALPLARAWRAAKGTALRPAVAWAAFAVGFGIVTEFLALRESRVEGWPWASHASYLSSLATLAALISVLNARRPGSGAWAILMVLLVVVFLLPWLEGLGLARRSSPWDRLRLEMPWSLFYGLVLLAGATNFLPTRYGPASLILGLSLGMELLGMTQTEWPLPRRGLVLAAFPWGLALALWVADARSLHGGSPRPGLNQVWFRFRDHWGVVWALRIQERWNRTAESAGWPFRLTWQGLAMQPGASTDDHTDSRSLAESTLKGLLRRFADEDVFENPAGGFGGDPCDPGTPERS